ncbi:MAG: hypothetical protein KY476_19420 [Planctomycetes bacterium]|nr:hypothetical protein [Planctomycetota bacterium]
MRAACGYGLRAACALAFAGCSICGPLFTAPHNVDDPAYLSPYLRSLQSAPPVQTPPGLPTLDPAIAPLPDDEPSPGPAFPELDEPVPDAGTGREPDVGLTVSAPERRRVGENAAFVMVVENRSRTAIDGLTIEATFDEALALPGREDRRVVRSLDPIEPGGTQEVTLTLVAREAGRHCASFLVTRGETEVGWKRVCVEFVR